MLVAGDEMGRTQKGNNNAYCQDNEISWLDWEHMDQDLFAFTQKLIQLRKKHPAFCRTHWFSGAPVKGQHLDDIAWFLPEGQEMTKENWNHDFAKSLAVFLNGKGIHAIGQDGKPLVDDNFYILFNAHHDPLEFHFPGKKYGTQWKKILDTAWNRTDTDEGVYGEGQSIIVEGRSVIVLLHP